MAMISTAHPIFSCASYRDPAIATTLHHFAKGLESLSAGIEMSVLEQCIIGSIGKIDAPRSPHDKALSISIDELSGWSKEHRVRFRKAILDAQPADIAAAIKRLLTQPQSASVVLGGASAFDQCVRDGIIISREPLLPHDAP